MFSIICLTKRITMNVNKFLLLFLCFGLTSHLALAQSTPLNPATWTINPADFSDNMIITGVIEVNNVEIANANYKISAFVNGQCRGVATPVYVPQLNRYLVTLFVYSNGGNEQVEFWVHNQTSNVVLPVIDMLAFNNAAPVGTPIMPYVFKTLQANVTFEKDDVLCAADNHGYAKASVSFGNGNQTYPYTLTWSTGSHDTIINNLSAGKYYLTVTVTNLFTFVDSVEILNLNRTIQKPNLLAAPDDEVCIGDDVFILAYTNETESPKYHWFNMFNQPITTKDVLTLPNLQADKLVYCQTEVRNCLSDLSSISVKVFSIPNVNFSILPTVGTVGEVVRFFTGDSESPNTVYRWNFGDGVINPNGKTLEKHTYEAEGVYKVTLKVTTAQGCSREESKLINVLKPVGSDDGGGGTQPDPLIFGFDVTEALCTADNSGSVSAQVFNGTAPIRYAWSNGGTTATIKNLAPGNYSVTITDAAGKRGVGTATVTAKYTGTIQAPAVIVNGGRPVCESSDIWVAAINNFPEAEVYWYNSQFAGTPIYQGNPLILFNIQENSTLFVETRVGGCASARTPVNIQVVELFSEFEASATIAPVGLQIDFASIGSDTAQTYKWDFGDGTTATGNATNHTFRNTGIYEVKLTASFTDGCSETSSKIIRITAQGALGVAFNITNVLCANDTTGSIAIEIASGTPPYTFAWSNGANGSVISNLGAGTYTVTITDGAARTRIEQVKITATNPPIDIPSVTVNGANVVCAGDNVLLAALTNVADAEYRWYDAPSGGNLLYNGASYPLNDIQENKQVYVEAFFNGCFSPGRASTLIQVKGPDATFTASAKTVNEGGTVNFNAKVIVASNTYQWNFGDGGTATGPTTSHAFESIDLYPVALTVTDSTGCSASTSQIIRVVSAADMVVSFLINNAECVNDQNGSVTATVFNGKPPFTFQWSNGASGNTLNNLRIGSYTVTVTDADGHSITETAEVSSNVGELVLPNIVNTADSIVCPNESFTLYAYNQQPGSFLYYWYDAPTGGNLVAVANVLNLYGRNLSDELYVETRVGGCKTDSREKIAVAVDDPNTGFSTSSTTIVEGDQLIFTPNLINPNYTYSWFFNDGITSSTITPSHTYQFPGIYRVRLDVTNGNGCLDSETLDINVISTTETAVVLKTTQPTCEGDTNGKIVAEVVNGTLPYTFLWSTGATTSTIDNLTGGTYMLTFTDAGGVPVVKTINLRAKAAKPATPTITMNANTPICYKDDLLLIGNTSDQASSYLWYDQNDNLLFIGSTLVVNDILQSGAFYLETQMEGCKSERASVNLQVQIPNASFNVNQNGLAGINESLSFLPAVATYPVYTWNFGDGNSSAALNPQHSYLNAGVFDVTLTVKDQDGCTNSLVKEGAASIIPADILKLSILVDDILCEADGAGSLTATPRAGTPPYTYLWSNGSTQATADNLIQGSYSVTVTDAEGRISTGNATIQNRNIQLLPPTITVNGNAPVCKGSDAFLLGSNSQFANAKTLWFDSNTAQNPLSTSELYILRQIENSRVIYAQSQVDGCNSTRIPVEISVKAPSADFRVTPSPDVMEGDVVQFRLTQMNPTYSYYWEFGDNGWSTNPEPYYFYNLGGKFDVKLTVVDPDGCENQLVKEDFVNVNLLSAPRIGSDPVDTRSGNPDNQKQSGIQAAFFPNPFQQDLTVILKVETTGSYKMQLTDLLGRTYFAQEMEVTANVPQQFQLEAGKLHLSNGIYLLQIENEHTRIIHKLLKQGF